MMVKFKVTLSVLAAARLGSFVVGLLLSGLAVAASGDPLKGCQEHIRYGEPLYVAAKSDAVRLCRLGYALSHNSGRKVPDWVAWHLSGPKALGCLPRKDSFATDAELEKGKRAELADYKIQD